MAYADSALDYSFRVHAINVDQGIATLVYYTDSTDTDRPDVFRNITLSASQFNDSDLQVQAKEAALSVVTQWDKIIERNAANPTFNDSDFINDTYSARYKPTVYDTQPSYNALTHKLVTSDSEGYDEIRVSYTVTAMSDSEKAGYRNSLNVSRTFLWKQLLREGRLDSAATSLGLYTGSYDSEEVDFLSADVLSFNDVLLTELRSTLGYNDSDFAALFVYADA
jgi:hypothetical protein